MKLIQFLPLALAGTMFTLPSFGQQNDGDKTSTKTEEKKEEKQQEPVAAKSNVKTKTPYEFFFNVHGGGGLYLFEGDVADNAGTNVHRLGNRFGYHFGIGATLNRWLDLNVNAMVGSLNGNEKSNRPGQNRNFETDVFGIGLELAYNFKNLGFFRDPRIMVPFVGGGAYFTTYDVRQDLKIDETGEVYYYWDDFNPELTQNQLIRNVDQNDPASDNVETLIRDFSYESRVYDSPVKSLAFPVFGGFDFNVDRKWSFRLKAAYFFTMTDAVDGYDNPNHSKNLDGYFYTSMSVFFKFNPFKKRVKPGEVPTDYMGDFGDMMNEDSDKDGVVDFVDKCNGTPQGVTVDSDGCALDGDKDGIPDYRDQQLNTAPGYVVDENGVAISYKAIYEKHSKDTVSLLHRNVDRTWLYSQIDTNAKYTVHVGTFTNYDIPTQLKMKLSAMSGLVERKINDSTSVFTLGSFDNFEAAEAKQNQLIKSGVDQAFGVKETAIKEVADEMKGLKSSGPLFSVRPKYSEEEEPDVLSYGVELREYRLRLDLNKLSTVIAKYGVEMTTTGGGMKIYRIGSFNNFEQAAKLLKEVEKLGVKNPEITARLNNASIELDKAKQKEEEMQSEKQD